MFIRNQGMTTELAWPFIGLVVIALLLAACGSSSASAPTPAPTDEPPPTLTPEPPTPTSEPATATLEPATPTSEPATPTSEPATPTPEPATATPEPPTPTPEPSSGTSSGGGQSGKNWIDEVFPPGHEKEMDLVMFNCGSCHVWTCTVIGQRTVGYWGTVRANHMDLVSGLGDEDYQLLFDFLAENFNDARPEPEVPEELRSLGCIGQ